MKVAIEAMLMQVCEKIKVLVDVLKTSVRHKSLWNAYAILCLVVFKNRGYDAWEGKSRTVEGVAELHFLVCIAVAAFEAVGLVCVKV